MPFHEAIIAAVSGIVARVRGVGGTPLRVALELVVPTFRTAGYFQNKLFKAIYGREPTPQERLMAGVTSGWPVPVNPFFVAFLSGMAYEDDEEVAEGWLSTFGKLLLSPVVETDLEQMLRGAVTGDFFQFMDALAEWTSEATGLETLAAFFRGIKEAAGDWEKLTGVGIPTNWLAEFLIWLNATVTGAFDEPFPWPWPGDPPPLPPGAEPRDFPPLVGEPIRIVPGPTYRLTTALAPGGTPLVTRTGPGPIGLGERGTIATADVLYTISNLAFKGPRPSLWGILQDQIPPDVREKFLWLLMGGGGAAQMFPGPGGGPPPGGDGGPPHPRFPLIPL